jgi:hypothetical protein
MQNKDALDETFEGAEGDSHARTTFAASTSVVRSDVSQSQGDGPSSIPDYVLCIVFHNPIVDLIGESSGTWTLANQEPCSQVVYLGHVPKDPLSCNMDLGSTGGTDSLFTNRRARFSQTACR